MKKFTTQEIRDLFNQVMREEISFPEMVEVLNERMSEANEPHFKDGDFLHSDWRDENITIIYRKINGNDIYYHVSKSNCLGLNFDKDRFWANDGDFRLATESKKKELIDALAEVGKHWNEEKKCIEDIPKRKFKKGDKVRIKHGISSKTPNNVAPSFVEGMDELIGKTMTIDRYTDRNTCVKCEGIGWFFHEDWLEPYVEELKEGDLAIFWDNDKNKAVIGKYGHFTVGQYFPHSNHRGLIWINAIKFESKEQYERLIKGEI